MWGRNRKQKKQTVPIRYVYNYQLGKDEEIKGPIEDWRPYIPTTPTAQDLYSFNLSIGLSSMEAALDVLIVVAGEDTE